MAKVNVLGAGSWGTALSLLLHKNGHQVKLWSALENEVKMLNEKREHESKLPGVRIPEEVEITTDLEGCLRDVDVAVLAVPSPFTRSTAKQMAPFVKEGQIIVNVAKGVEEDTLMTLSDIISEEIPAANVCVLSGPSHAEEVGRGLPTTCVVSAAKRETAEYLQGIFMSPVFRVYDPGYPRGRTWRSTEKCHCTCGRHRRWPWIRRQYKGGSDYAWNRRDCPSWYKNGSKPGDFLWPFRYGGSDRNMCKCTQP